MAVRRNFVIGMIGANGTGKSTITKELVEKWKKARPEGKVIVYDPQRQFGEYADFLIRDDFNWAQPINEKIRNSLIILDDYKNLIPNYVPTPFMRDLFINRRFHNNDYIYSCHSPADVIDMLTYYTTHYYMFHTKAIQGKFKEKMPNAHLTISASRYVNKYVSVFGLGRHPKSPDFDGQKFPYIMVDTEEQSLKAVNMNQKLR